MISPFIGIIVIGALLLGTFNAIGDAVMQFLENGLSNVFTVDGEGVIIINDEQIDALINSITELGVDIDGLKLMGDVDYTNPDIQEENKKALRTYIRKFYEAQAVTQTLNTMPSWISKDKLKKKGSPHFLV